MVGWEARVFFSRTAAMTGFIGQLISTVILKIGADGLVNGLSQVLAILVEAVSLVLKRRSPASEERSAPSKFILIWLLLSRLTVFKISIERPSF